MWNPPPPLVALAGILAGAVAALGLQVAIGDTTYPVHTASLGSTARAWWSVFERTEARACLSAGERVAGQIRIDRTGRISFVPGDMDPSVGECLAREAKLAPLVKPASKEIRVKVHWTWAPAEDLVVLRRQDDLPTSTVTLYTGRRHGGAWLSSPHAELWVPAGGRYVLEDFPAGHYVVASENGTTDVFVIADADCMIAAGLVPGGPEWRDACVPRGAEGPHPPFRHK
jgi:hypothetical protein